MDGGRRILQSVTRPQGPRAAEPSSFFARISGHVQSNLDHLSKRTSPPRRVRSRPRRHAAGAWADAIAERLSAPRVIDIAVHTGSIFVLGGAIVLGIFTGGHAETFTNGLVRVVDQAAAASGLRVTAVEISGNRVIDDEAVLDTAGLVPGGSLVGFDARRARVRLESLPWIASARVQKFFPDTLAIDVVERQPFAVWQHEGAYHIIDDTGVLLRPVSIEQLPDLPVVVGKGGGDGAAILFGALSRHPGIATKVIASVRVAERRWTLHLENGIEVRLPEHGLETALIQLADLDRQARMLKRDVALIDLRIAGRVFVRPRDADTGDKVARSGAAS